MASLKNSLANMEIGYTYDSKSRRYKLYIQVGNERKYYGTLITNKQQEFLEMLKKWDEIGGNDGN